MIEAALKYLKSQFAPTMVKVGDKDFSDETFMEIKPQPDPLHGSFEVTTLGALRDLINSNVTEQQIEAEAQEVICSQT